MRGILAMKQVVEPVAEARNEFDIFADIAERLGQREAFTEGKSEMEWLRGFYDVALEQAESRGLHLSDFETFWEQGVVVLEPVRLWCTDAVGAGSSDCVEGALAPKSRAALARSDVNRPNAPLH